LTWAPFDGFQTEFCKAGAFEVLAGGAAGPGKTDCLIALALRHIDKPRYKALLLRRTTPRIQEIKDRCHEIYPQFGGVYLSGNSRWHFPSGATIKLGHMEHEEDKRNYHGGEFQFVGFDELTEFSESQYLFVFSRMRSAHDPELPSRIRSTTNPGGIGHSWVKDRFVDIAPPRTPFIDPRTGLSRVFIPGVVQDNLALMENDPGYIQRLEALPEIDRRRYLLGDWSVFEGQVFSDLNPRWHQCEPFELPRDWEYFGCLDWGFMKPFSYGVYAIDYDDVLYRVMEWYGCKEGEVDRGIRMVASDVADEILERESKLGVKVKWRIADPSIFSTLPKFRHREAIGKRLFEDFEARGVYFEKADNERVQGWNQVHMRFQVDREADPETGEITSEQSRFYAFSDQFHFWRVMPEIQSDRRNLEDIDTRQEDHIPDELRYACMARQVKPKRLPAKEVGTFRSERDRFLRAKRLARRLGISVTQAYQRV